MIKNIIFDIGWVLLGYKWLEPLMNKGISEEAARKISIMILDSDIWHFYDRGDMSHAEAMDLCMEKFPDKKEEIKTFFDGIYSVHIPRPEVWKRIPALKEKGYRLYILSNYPKELFLAHTEDADFMKHLDGGVVSYQVHMNKPDKEIYECLLNKYRLKPQECIFFDDRAENTEAAEALGIAGVVITSEKKLIEEIEKL